MSDDPKRARSEISQAAAQQMLEALKSLDLFNGVSMSDDDWARIDDAITAAEADLEGTPPGWATLENVR